MSDKRENKPHSLTIRLTAAQYQRLHNAAKNGPYEVTITQVVTRGIELASIERERMHEATRGIIAEKGGAE